MDGLDITGDPRDFASGGRGRCDPLQLAGMGCQLGRTCERLLPIRATRSCPHSGHHGKAGFGRRARVQRAPVLSRRVAQRLRGRLDRGPAELPIPADTTSTSRGPGRRSTPTQWLGLSGRRHADAAQQPTKPGCSRRGRRAREVGRARLLQAAVEHPQTGVLVAQCELGCAQVVQGVDRHLNTSQVIR